MHYLYIIYSAQLDRYYIGVSSDPSDRLRKHNTNHRGFTGRANDWVLAHQEAFQTKTQALQRERRLKSWKSRQLIEKLIAGK